MREHSNAAKSRRLGTHDIGKLIPGMVETMERGIYDEWGPADNDAGVADVALTHC